jgi:acyl carrier protein
MEQTFSGADNIERKLSEIIARASFTKVPANKIKLTDMLHDVGIDSLSFMEIVVYIEEEFDITVADKDLASERFDTVGALKSYIEEKRADTTADRQ